DGENFEKMLKLMGRCVEYSSASLFLVNRQSGQLDNVAYVGKRVDLIDFVKFDMGQGFSAYVAKEKRPIFISHLHRKSHNSKNSIHSFVSIPLMIKNELVGVLNLSHIRDDAYTKSDLDFLTIFAGQVSIFIERMLYQSELDKKDKELEKAQNLLRETRERSVDTEKLSAISQVATSINHEINNPLAVIAGNTQYLLMTMKNVSPNVKKRLKAIDNEVNQISQVTRKLLKIKKLVVEDYIDGHKDKMLNLDESTK
ncbi:MAG: GAF domain-containing protein, partial [candidate division Zixibacteria bacterium]|nr:GAF domain-containing protein [candidate division Zixibacteria bacterium]